MNLDEMKSLFIDSRKRGMFGARWECRPKTIRIYENNLRCLVNYMAEAGVVNYLKVNRLHLTGFMDFMKAKEKRGEWSDATRLQVLRTLRAFFRWVLKDDDCDDLIEHTVRLQKYMPMIQDNKPRGGIPETKMLKKFNNSFDTNKLVEHRDYVAFCLMAGTGMRIGEVCDLKLSDVSWENTALVVAGKTQRHTGKRVVIMPEDLVAKLKGWIKRRSSIKAASSSEYVFVSRISPKMNPDAWATHIARFRKKHDLPKISAHTFRHAFCTNYLVRGGDMKRLKNITGHTSYRILENYVKTAETVTSTARAELEKVNLLKEL